MTTSLFRQLLIQPLGQHWQRLVNMLILLLLMAAAQAVFLFLVGPLFKLLVSADDRSSPLIWQPAEILPQGLQGQAWLRDSLATWQLDFSSLAIGIPCAIVLCGLLRSLASYGFHVLQQYVAIDIAANYRNHLFAAIVGQDYLCFLQRSPAHWMSMIINDVMYLQNRFSELAASLLKDSVVLGSCVLALLFIHWQTALVILLLAPLLGAVLGFIGRRIAAYAEKWQAMLAEMASLLLGMRQRFAFIRAQQGERWEQQRFDRVNRGYLQTIRRSLLLRALFAPGLEFLGFASFALILAAQQHEAWFAAGFGGSELIQFFAAFGLMLRPVRNLGEQLSRYHEARGALQSSLLQLRVSLENAAKTESDSAKTSKIWSPASPLRIEKLTVSYKEADQNLAFHGEALSVRAGQAIAIIGPSGAGKSTLLKVLAGLVHPQIFAANVPLGELRRQVAYVSQEPFLFDASLRENLSYGLSAPPPDEQLRRVLDLVELSPLFQPSRDQGGGSSGEVNLDFPLRSLQQNLSGGQVQRLTIARCLLKKADIWLFDEATAALDVQVEEMIVEKLLDWMKKKNSRLLYVTHRLENLAKFDQVWFIENGKVCLVGTHHELLQSARYKQFILQSS